LFFIEDETVEGQINYINIRLDYLMGSRPTAVDLSNAIRLLKITVNTVTLPDGNNCGRSGISSSQKMLMDARLIRSAYILTAEKILEDDLTTNLAIGRYGAEYLRRQQMPVSLPIDETDEMRYFTTSPPGTQGAPDRTYKKLSVLTHCNTGYEAPNSSHTFSG
jgi:methylthioribose-1-phosphate isomerase